MNNAPWWVWAIVYIFWAGVLYWALFVTPRNKNGNRLSI